ncbi:uncharacterized protein [Nicotiana tomentosiformis]|uniref:uncharacterized protein n=1 Tax=Nicotiana tomentosiformis TaxID=4098 RepID=UPI00388C7313
MDQFKCHKYQQFLKDDSLLGLQDDQNVKHFGRRSIVNLVGYQYSPCFWQMLREIIKFKQDVMTYLEALDNNSDIDRNETLGHFIQFSICASIWFCPSKRVMSFFCLLHSFILSQPSFLYERMKKETKTFDDFVSRVQNGIRFAWRKKLEN